MEDTPRDDALGCDDYGRGVSVLPDGVLDQDALWETVAEDHPELDPNGQTEGGASRGFASADPYVHLQCHVLVENQLHADEPPHVRKALTALTSAGLNRHEAVHAIAAHAFELLLAPMGANPLEKEQQYLARLVQLTRHPEFVVRQ